MNTSQSSTELLNLTDTAIAHLTQMVHTKAAVGVVIALEKAGCAGYMYRIELTDTAPDCSIRLSYGSALHVFVPNESVPRIQGSQLDYQMCQLEKKAVFDNPNVTLACGCGDSVELITAEG